MFDYHHNFFRYFFFILTTKLPPPPPSSKISCLEKDVPPSSSKLRDLFGRHGGEGVCKAFSNSLSPPYAPKVMDALAQFQVEEPTSRDLYVRRRTGC